MRRIGIISDTHGLLRPEIADILHGCEAIIHGGDIGKQEILDGLNSIAPTYAVCGNIDGGWTQSLPETFIVELCGIKFHITHNKKRIPKDVKGADVIIYGHSHKYEEKYAGGLLYLNPGSCGPKRFRLPVTMAVLEIAEPGDELSGQPYAEPSVDASTEDAYTKDAYTALSVGHVLYHVKRIEIPQKFSDVRKEGTSNGEKPRSSNDADEAGEERIPKNIKQVIKSVMKDTDRGIPVKETAVRNGINEQLAEQICRLYLTHPGVDADGIMTKMGL